MAESATHCISQQTLGKTCRDDPYLQTQPALWCGYCEAAAELEESLSAWAVLGYI